MRRAGWQHHVAMHQQGRADTDGDTVYRGNQRLFVANQSPQEPDDRCFTKSGPAGVLQEVANIVAGGKNFRQAADQMTANIRIRVACFQSFGEITVHLPGQGVLLFRPSRRRVWTPSSRDLRIIIYSDQAVQDARASASNA